MLSALCIFNTASSTSLPLPTLQWQSPAVAQCHRVSPCVTQPQQASPVRHTVAKLQSRGEGQAPIFPPRNEGAGREAGPAAYLPLLTAYPAPGPCPALSADADHAARADRPPPNKGGV